MTSVADALKEHVHDPIKITDSNHGESPPSPSAAKRKRKKKKKKKAQEPQSAPLENGMLACENASVPNVEDVCNRSFDEGTARNDTLDESSSSG